MKRVSKPTNNHVNQSTSDKGSEHASTRIVRLLQALLAIASLAVFWPVSSIAAAELNCEADSRITESFSNGASWDLCWESRIRENLVLSDVPGAWGQRWKAGFQRFADAVEGRGRPRLHHDDLPAAAAAAAAAAACLAEPASPPPDDRPIWGHALDFRQELQRLQTFSHEHPKVVCALTGLVPELAGLDRLSLSDDKVAPVVSFDLIRCAAGIDKHPVTKHNVLFELDGRPWPQGEHNDGGACAVYERVYDLMLQSWLDNCGQQMIQETSMPSLPLDTRGNLKKGELPTGTHVYIHYPSLRHSGPARAGNALSAMNK